MSGKIKLLWIGDSPAVTTGFGRVAQGILEGLIQTGNYQVSVLGINHPIGDPHRYEGMIRIYPARARGNIYGFDRVEEVIAREKPDVIILLNDLWILSEYIKFIPENNRIITYSPVDALPVDKVWVDNLEKVNARVTTYTQFAKRGILDANSDIKIDVVGHGVDTDEFYQMDDARRFLANIPEDSFVVQNVNRNQPRKRLDLFLKGMQIWLDRLPKSDRDNIRLYYHGTLRDVGWNLISLAKRWGIDDRFLITDQSSMTPARGVPLSMLCKIYNCADVHIMTSMGEGFGLSPFESAACGVAQVVPNHSATKELWEGKAPLIDIARWEVLTGGINTEGGVIDLESMVAILDDLYHHRDKLDTYAQKAYEYVHRNEFTWEYIANQFDIMINEVLNAGNESLSKKFSVDEKIMKEIPESSEEADKLSAAGEQRDDNKVSLN